MARITPAGGSEGPKGPEFDAVGHLGVHKVTKEEGRLLKTDIPIDMQTHDEHKFTADRTVPDGQLTQVTDFLGRTFLFGKKGK